MTGLAAGLETELYCGSLSVFPGGGGAVHCWMIFSWDYTLLIYYTKSFLWFM